MDAYLSESMTDTAGNISSSVGAFTDEIEGELEKISIFGVNLTRKVTISIVTIFTVIAISTGVALSVTLSSPSSSSSSSSTTVTSTSTSTLTTTVNDNIDNSVFERLDHNYWSFGEALESTIGKEIYDNSTHEHEALTWLATDDTLKLDVTTPLDVLLQRYILADFYFATNGTTWTDQFHFLSGKDECDWNDGKSSGVFCNDEGRVSNILLQDCNLVGTVPHEIGLLSHMEILNLTKNGLHGNIPISLGMMSGLKRIDMSLNRFSGQIPPTVAMLLYLEVLNFSFNSLKGEDGARALKDLPNLEELYMSHNILEGNIGHLGKSETLRVVDLSSNFIQGTIPGSFGEGKNLKYLYLNDNELHGVIHGIGNLKNLVELDVSNNKLSGSLPSTFGDLSTLQTLKINSNNLQSELPTEFGYLNQLSMLQLSDNGLTKIPYELFGLKNLQTLTLSDNNLSGSLPTYIGLATSLIYLDLSNNKLSKELPFEISNLEILEELYLSNNRFDGTVPSVLSNLFLLKTVDISNNNFFGDMDVAFCGDDRPEWGNPIESYRADCLSDDISFSCATECCNENNYCCNMPDETNCRISD